MRARTKILVLLSTLCLTASAAAAASFGAQSLRAMADETPRQVSVDQQVVINGDIRAEFTATGLQTGDQLRVWKVVNESKVDCEFECVEGDKANTFKLFISPKDMATEYHLQFVDVDNNVINIDRKDGSVEQTTFSVMDYCDQLLEKDMYEYGYTSESYASMQTFVYSLLNYGSAAQVYKNYNTETLANSVINEENRGVADIENVPTNIIRDGADDGNVTWKSANVIFDNQVALQFKFETTAEATISIKKNGEGDNLLDSYTSTTEEKDGTTHYCYTATTKKIAPTDYDKVMKATVSINGEAVGQTLGYSVNTYAARMQTKGSDEMKDLAKALYAYGVAANNYKVKAYNPYNFDTAELSVENDELYLTYKGSYDNDNNVQRYLDKYFYLDMQTLGNGYVTKGKFTDKSAVTVNSESNEFTVKVKVPELDENSIFMHFANYGENPNVYVSGEFATQRIVTPSGVYTLSKKTTWEGEWQNNLLVLQKYTISSLVGQSVSAARVYGDVTLNGNFSCQNLKVYGNLIINGQLKAVNITLGDEAHQNVSLSIYTNQADAITVNDTGKKVFNYQFNYGTVNLSNNVKDNTAICASENGHKGGRVTIGENCTVNINNFVFAMGQWNGAAFKVTNNGTINYYIRENGDPTPNIDWESKGIFVEKERPIFGNVYYFGAESKFDASLTTIENAQYENNGTSVGYTKATTKISYNVISDGDYTTKIKLKVFFGNGDTWLPNYFRLFVNGERISLSNQNITVHWDWQGDAEYIAELEISLHEGENTILIEGKNEGWFNFFGFRLSNAQ